MKVTVSKEIAGQNRYADNRTRWQNRQTGPVFRSSLPNTVVFTAAQSGPSRPGTDFFPLTVEYRERLASAGTLSRRLPEAGRPADARRKS